MIAVLAVAGAALIVALVVRGNGGHYEVDATFSDVRGLVKGAEVRAGGLRVGRVDSIALRADGLPHARLSIDSSYPIHRGARAAVRLASMSGEFNAYVSITSGSGARLPDGVALPLASTTSPVQIDAALRTLDPRTRAELRSVLVGLTASTAGRGPDVERTLARSATTLQQAGALARDVSADGASLRALVANADSLTRTLSARETRLGPAVDSTAALLHVAAGRASELRTAVAGAPASLDASGRALASARAAVGPMRGLLHDARPALPLLGPAAREAAPLLRGARPALEQAAALVRVAPVQVRTLTSLLTGARPAMADLGPVLATAGPMLDESRARLPDAFSFFANWADFTSNYDANGHAARVGIVLPPAPTNELAPDSNGPGQLKAPFLRDPGALEGEPWRDYRRSFVSGRAR